MLLFVLLSLLVCAECGSHVQNCSRPDQPSLLEALKPAFELSSIRPVHNASNPTIVYIDVIPIGILGVDEKAQILTTFIWQSLAWQNEFVSWDRNQCGSGWIMIPRKLMWQPDVVIKEFMDQNSAPATPYSVLFDDGYVLDTKPLRVVSSCALDIYMFPFDYQICSLSFNSYTYRKAALQIDNENSGKDILETTKDSLETVGEWELLGVTVKKYELQDDDKEPYEEIRYSLSLRRRPTMYVVNLLIPSGFLVTVDMLSFLLPPQSVDRSAFKMTLILGYTVFLLIMNDLLPTTGDTIPLINVFLSLCLGLMVASLLETVLITNLMLGSAHRAPVPRWIRVFVLRILGRLVRLPPKSQEPRGDAVIENPAAHEMNVSPPVAEGSEAPERRGALNQDDAVGELRGLGGSLRGLRLRVDELLGGNQSTEEWIRVGLILDRLLFGLYVLFLSVSLSTIVALWVQSHNRA